MTRPNIPRRHGRSRSAGFTLVEILVVFLIIGLLVGLLLPAINAAVRNAQNARVTAEITQMAAALADFKAKHGEFPPSRILLCENGWYATADNTPLSNGARNENNTDMTVGELAQRSVSALRRYWPRMVLQTTTGTQVSLGTNAFQAAGLYDFNGNGVQDAPYVLQGHECLVFFLGGVPAFRSETTTLPLGGAVSNFGMTGWSNLPANPFLSPTVSANSTRTPPFFEFKGDRLIAPQNSHSGIPGYYDPLGDPLVTDTTNFYMYFSAYGNSGYDPNDCNFYSTVGRQPPPFLGPTVPGVPENDARNPRVPPGLKFSNGVTTYNTYRQATAFTVSPAPNPYTSTSSYLGNGTIKPTYINPQSFQIISAGRDGQYGWGGQYTPNATGTTLPLDLSAATPYLPVTTDSTIRFRERDNVTNFKTGTLE